MPVFRGPPQGGNAGMDETLPHLLPLRWGRN